MVYGKRIIFLTALLVFLLLGFAQPVLAQSDSIEIFLIDSFISPEKPNEFQLVFYTNLIQRHHFLLLSLKHQVG